jgi:preprotein translocase subunit SecF
MASVVLFLFGGEVLRDFAFALVVGVVLGTYSTVAAASLIVDWETWSRSRQSSPRKVPAKA